METARNWRIALGAALAAAIVMTAAPVVGSVGDAILAGMVTTADQQTVLKGSVPGTNLKITNTHPDGSANSFVVQPGNPPFKVNTSTKVKNLNADKVDGKSAGAFLQKKDYDENKDGVVDISARSAGAWHDDMPDGADTGLVETITTPTNGVLTISGGIDAHNSEGYDAYVCYIYIENEDIDGYIVGSARWSEVSGGGPANWNEDCSTTASIAVEAGTYDVTFVVGDVADTTEFFESSVSIIWTPLNGAGDVPASDAKTMLRSTDSLLDGAPHAGE